MSESDAHRDLVMLVATRIESKYPGSSVVSDRQQLPGDLVPPLIGGFRPDVYATVSLADSVSVIIAEAKTNADIRTDHSERQVLAFIRHLEQKESGRFILAATGWGADRAKTILRFIREADQISHTDLMVFDGCDFWELDSQRGVIWRLI